jgi:deoxyribodipyrimidine photolyase
MILKNNQKLQTLHHHQQQQQVVDQLAVDVVHQHHKNVSVFDNNQSMHQKVQMKKQKNKKIILIFMNKWMPVVKMKNQFYQPKQSDEKEKVQHPLHLLLQNEGLYN